MRITRYITFLALSLLPASGFAQQVTARVPDLQNNPEYMELLRGEARLRVREDSILKVTDATRERFQRDPDNRQQYGGELLRLEQEVFDVRNQLGIVTGRISRIEQDWVVSNLNRQSDYSQPKTPGIPGDTIVSDSVSGGFAAIPAKRPDSPYLLNNRSFTERFKASDLQALQDAQSRERSVVDLLSAYRANYLRIRQLHEAYLAAENAPAADTIYAQYEMVAGLNGRIADSVEVSWAYIWDNKIYSCSYLADYLNKNELLSGFDKRIQDLRHREAEYKGRFAHDAAGFYAWEKELVLDYEIQLADMLGLAAAKDSLIEAKRYVDPRAFDFSAVDFERRYFFDYDSVKILSQTRYSTRNPIPETQVFPRGTIYRIVLGTFVKAQPVSVFRNAYPLSYQALDDGRYRYFAGGYRTQEEAESAVAILQRAGFRHPEVVVWQDGVYRTAAEASASGSVPASTTSAAKPATATKPASSGHFYRIEISGADSDLSPQVKTIISTFAPGKDLARVAVPAQDGVPASYVFLLGSFDNQTTAQQIANAITNQSPTLNTKIIEVK